jgi:predicted dehydrogenase
MPSNENNGISRRELGKRVGQAAAVSALAGFAIPAVHAAGDSTIQIVLIGCGGRGTGAAGDALKVKAANLKLVAMADVFKDRLDGSFNTLSRGKTKDKVNVPEDRKFIGFDAYQKAMDCLKAGDIAIFTTPLAFRWVHFTYAIEKGLNVFMEKPLSADGAASRRMLALAEQASAKNLKVGVGLMSRHARHLQELQKRIEGGEIGDIILMRGYRMAGPVASFQSTPKPQGISDLEYQIRRFHSFIWASGGCFNDFNIHQIDHLCWMKGKWPVKAQGVGGRHYKFADDGQPFVDQNFDSYGIEYTFDDDTKLYFDGRCMTGAQGVYSSHVHGTKGSAIAASSGDCDGPSITFKGTTENKGEEIWHSTDHSGPYQNEWDDLVEAILNDKPYNEVPRGVMASVTSSMGRASAHVGREVTFDEMLHYDLPYAPAIDKITFDSPAPLMPDEKGFYPKPEPGRKKWEF